MAISAAPVEILCDIELMKVFDRANSATQPAPGMDRDAGLHQERKVQVSAPRAPGQAPGMQGPAPSMG